MEIGLLIFLFATASALAFREGLKHGKKNQCDACLRMGLETGFKAGVMAQTDIKIEVVGVKES